MTGKGFMSRVLFSIALVVTAPSHAANAGQPCQLTKVTDLTATVTPFNQILVDGGVKGEPVRLQIDTGSAETLFDGAVISRFGIANNGREVTAHAMGGEFKQVMARIPGLKIGSFDAGNRIVNVAETHFLGGDIYALLGADILTSFDLDIDLAKNTIGLFEHNSCPGEPVYWANNFSEADLVVRKNGIIVLIEINGVPARAVLDTGAERTIVSMNLAHRLGIDTDTAGVEKAGTVRGVDGRRITSYQYRFSMLKVGDEAVKNPVLRIADIAPVKFDPDSMKRIQPGNLNIEALLGADFIRSHHIYIDINRQTMYFTWNGGSVFSPPKEESGDLR
jgi:predicted aspartyl protease